MTRTIGVETFDNMPAIWWYYQLSLCPKSFIDFDVFNNGIYIMASGLCIRRKGFYC